MRLEGQRALVTGASRGLGRAIAIALACRGAHVTLTATCFDPLDVVLQEIQALGGQGDIVVADLLVRSDRHRLAEAVAMTDILINNAGSLGGRDPLVETSLATFERTLELNATAPFDLIRLLVPGMIGRGRGTIINLSSSVGKLGRGGWGAYSASKAALEGLSESLSDELQGSGVQCVVVNPGGTRTDMRREAKPDEDPMTLPSPEQIAMPLVDIVLQNDGRHHGKRYNLREWLGIS